MYYIYASDDPSLRLDLGIQVVWQPQVETLFDIRVIDTDHRRRKMIFVRGAPSQTKVRKQTLQFLHFFHTLCETQSACMCSMLMLGRSGGMPPRKILKIRHCEIESASFLRYKHGVAMYISILIY